MKQKKFLGSDAHGFRYYLCDDLYVYQQYPATDYWHEGHNYKNEWNGWLCSSYVWDTVMHKILVKGGE